MPELEQPMLVFKPTFEVMENMAIDLGDKKVGQRVKMIVNYVVIEETKRFVVLRINSMSLAVSKRTF